jgi:transposase
MGTRNPKRVREGAVFEAKKNLDSGITNLKNKNIKYFQLKFKSKKDLKWSIVIPKESIKIQENGYLGIYEERTTNFRIKLTEKITEINHDTKIHFDGKDYYICVPYKAVKKPENRNKNWFCSLDPGIRKFQVLYNADEDNYIKFADRASTKMYQLLRYLDFLSKEPKKNKKKMIALRLKIQCYQKEMHCKITNYLCENFNNIYIPKLTSGNDIIKKKDKFRTLSKSSVRQMVVLGHCKFVERLKTKALEYEDVNVNVIGEEYTSQTCLNCNNLTKTKKEIFKCKHCKLKMDRDLLGSTNILLFNW